MASYYTEAYTKNVCPDATSPAGVLLCNGTQYIAKTDGLAQNDIVYMVRIPEDAVLHDVCLSWSAGGSNTTITVGTSAGADSIANAMSTVGIGAWSLSGGVQGTTAIATGLKTASSIRRGYKFTAADYIKLTFAGSSGFPADGVIDCQVTYYMDFGADLSTEGDDVD